MTQTESTCNESLAIDHILRTRVPDNVDPSLTVYNVTLIDRLKPYGYDLSTYTDAVYQPFIDVYNAGRKPSQQISLTYSEYFAEKNRKSRQIRAAHRERQKKTPLQPKKLAYELVARYGTRETNSTLKLPGESEAEYSARMQANRDALTNVVSAIEERFTRCRILLAVYHQDEPNETPNVCIVVQFDGEGFKKGLAHQVNVKRALEGDGFSSTSGKCLDILKRWAETIKDEIMEPQLELCFHQEREVPGEHRSHDEIHLLQQNAIENAEVLSCMCAEPEKAMPEDYDKAQQSLTTTIAKLAQRQQELCKAKVHKRKLSKLQPDIFVVKDEPTLLIDQTEQAEEVCLVPDEEAEKETTSVDTALTLKEHKKPHDASAERQTVNRTIAVVCKALYRKGALKENSETAMLVLDWNSIYIQVKDSDLKDSDFLS